MTTFWLAVLYVHLISMAFFVGGQLFMAVAVVPAQRRDPNTAQLRAIARRFGIGSLVAIALLLVTGVAMATQFKLWQSGMLHTKLALVVVAGVLIGLHMRYPRAHVLSAAVFLVSLVIVWLGVDLSH